MLKTFTNWVSFPNNIDSWETWEYWQKSQQKTHFEYSDIFAYYLSKRPQFKTPRFSYALSQQSKYYIYCFGDFTALLLSTQCSSNVIDYFTLLLDFYDVCKGTTRRLSGDPSGILCLRHVVAGHTLVPLQDHDLKQYLYDYTKIHAHTVAQYSLSTLLMRFASHYMNCLSIKGTYAAIELQYCQKTYDSGIFGEVEKKNITKPLAINKPNIEEMKASSWPRNDSSSLRCKVCQRVCENLWGKFNTCLDCHLKRVCSVCSIQAVIISLDGLPKCEQHDL